MQVTKNFLVLGNSLEINTLLKTFLNYTKVRSF